MKFLNFLKFESNGYIPLPNATSSPKLNLKRRNIIIVCCTFVVLTLLTANFVVWQKLRYVTALDDYLTLNSISAVDVSDISRQSNDILVHVPAHNERAIVTSLFSEGYMPGILVLANSLKSVNTSARLILMYFPERISSHSLCLAETAGWELHPVERIAPPDDTPLFWRYADQYTKLRIWTLDTLGIKTAIYLDGDVLVRKNFDELFTLPFTFAAVPDVYKDRRGFSLAFNAGMLLFRTSSATYEDMMNKVAVSRYERPEAEQGFLRMYFAQQVVHLPYIYNANLAIKVRSPDLWRAMLDEIRIIHYTLDKPFAVVKGATGVEVDERLQRKTLAERRSMYGGLWNVEMGWWEEHYNETLHLRNGSCEKSSRSRSLTTLS